MFSAIWQQQMQTVNAYWVEYYFVYLLYKIREEKSILGKSSQIPAHLSELAPVKQISLEYK